MKRRTLVLTAILLSGLFLSANAQECCEKESFSFVFMTDIHLQTERDADEGFTKAIEKVNELNPDFVITGGDLIMDALEQTKERSDSLYQLYQKVTSKFDMPVFNTIGNHEHYAFYMKDEIERDDPDYGDKMFRRYMGKPYYSFNNKGWHFIILNSIMETADRRYRGGISEDQIEWLKEDLANVCDKTPITVSVHIPFITAMNQMNDGSMVANTKGDVINNSKEVLALFKNKNLRLVLQGHLHYLEDLYMQGKTHFITGGAVSSNWWKGPRFGMEEGFLYITVKGEELDWEYVDFGWEPKIEE